jgi:hypothetical protein
MSGGIFRPLYLPTKGTHKKQPSNLLATIEDITPSKQGNNMQLYTSTAVEKLINRYIEKGGQVATIREGSLGHGTIVCHGDKLKTAVINERYINEWNSGHTIRFYRKMPKTYAKLID